MLTLSHPDSQEIYNFNIHTLAHHDYIPSLSNLCLGVEKNIFKEICIFTKRLVWLRPSTRSHVSGVMEFTIWKTIHWLSLLNIQFVWSMPGNWEEDFHRNNAFICNICLIWPHISTQNPCPGGHGICKFDTSSQLSALWVWVYNFLSLTLQMLHTKFSKDWPSSSWEEDVNERRTTPTQCP